MTTALTDIPADKPMPAMPPLVLADRCDRCGSQAFVRVFIGESELMFCGHHYTKHEAGLAGSATHVQDERHTINKAPSISANAI